jgi:hypothetical protein
VSSGSGFWGNVSSQSGRWGLEDMGTVGLEGIRTVGNIKTVGLEQYEEWVIRLGLYEGWNLCRICRDSFLWK